MAYVLQVRCRSTPTQQHVACASVAPLRDSVDGPHVDLCWAVYQAQHSRHSEIPTQDWECTCEKLQRTGHAPLDCCGLAHPGPPQGGPAACLLLDRALHLCACTRCQIMRLPAPVTIAAQQALSLLLMSASECPAPLQLHCLMLQPAKCAQLPCTASPQALPHSPETSPVSTTAPRRLWLVCSLPRPSFPSSTCLAALHTARHLLGHSTGPRLRHAGTGCWKLLWGACQGDEQSLWGVWGSALVPGRRKAHGGGSGLSCGLALFALLLCLLGMWLLDLTGRYSSC